MDGWKRRLLETPEGGRKLLCGRKKREGKGGLGQGGEVWGVIRSM